MADRNTKVRSGQIKNTDLKPEDLKAADAPTDGQVPSYDLSTGDFEWTSVTVGLFEVDGEGGLMPITGGAQDNYYELDGNDDIQPK
jgi:hypothetical protein